MVKQIIRIVNGHTVANPRKKPNSKNQTATDCRYDTDDRPLAGNLTKAFLFLYLATEFGGKELRTRSGEVRDKVRDKVMAVEMLRALGVCTQKRVLQCYTACEHWAKLMFWVLHLGETDHQPQRLLMLKSVATLRPKCGNLVAKNDPGPEQTLKLTRRQFRKNYEDYYGRNN
jgi:hypothetical protein